MAVASASQPHPYDVEQHDPARAVIVAMVALGRLDDREREAFIDHEIVGRTYAQIAVSMGLSREGVRFLVERARRRLPAIAVAVEATT